MFSCKQSNLKQKQSISGNTMGTYYSIKYIGEQQSKLQSQIDSLLEEINQSLSTYIPNSTISKVNSMPAGTITVDQYFIDNFQESRKIYFDTGGAFNPAIMPLVDYWGFGSDKQQRPEEVDSNEVKSLLAIVDLNQFELKSNTLVKLNDQSKLDFSGIAKGYAVDQIATFLLAKRIEHFIIDIGGENTARGLNEKGKTWSTGVRMPPEKDDKGISILQPVQLNNRSIATSGNYENYYELKNKQVVSHTINPRSGYPQSLDEEIISSTVVAPMCSTADAYATAFKVLGIEQSKEILRKHPELSVLFVYENEQGKIKEYSTILDD